MNRYRYRKRERESMWPCDRYEMGIEIETPKCEPIERWVRNLNGHEQRLRSSHVGFNGRSYVAFYMVFVWFFYVVIMWFYVV